ncbi:hypothetical protein [Megamonas hypermegale]|uniref:hypothetical protein n=2 Tax=Megamonas hypermegale TaxID=158847 RepID=UPI0025A39267|nr:hypothetical protein [Megamonas hypermegale]MDM8142726.1 hypothetical protein [Megamonas hypermegale]
MASACSLMLAVLVLAHGIMNFFVDYVDTWMLQNETRRIFEDMVTEIEYADEVEYNEKSSTKKELIIATRRRSAATPNEMKKYLSFLREGPTMYRNELSKLKENLYTVRSTQPLNSENYFGTNKMNFTFKKLQENLFELEFTGYSYTTDKTITLHTVILNRSAGEPDDT